MFCVVVLLASLMFFCDSDVVMLVLLFYFPVSGIVLGLVLSVVAVGCVFARRRSQEVACLFACLSACRCCLCVCHVHVCVVNCYWCRFCMFAPVSLYVSGRACLCLLPYVTFHVVLACLQIGCVVTWVGA